VAQAAGLVSFLHAAGGAERVIFQNALDFRIAAFDQASARTPMPVVTVTRRLSFNAAHRVHNPALSEEENKALFGKCNNPNWHGHNYTLDVSVTGPIEERTGYVIDLGRVKAIVNREVIDKVDHRNFNLEVDFMRGVIPTTENIVAAMWRVLAPAIEPAKLTRLVLWETQNNYVEYDGK
jgi:6-pyruvoyltetrahydropterin/6-carboxytetrahydropterin synthase